MFRLLTAVAFLGTMGVSAYFRIRARRESETIERRREGGMMAAFRAVVALPLFGGILLYIIAPPLMNWASFGAPGWIRWLGAILGISSIPLAFWVFSSLGNSVSETVLTKKEHVLVTHGPYRWVRHPLYSMGLILFAGAGLMNSSWFILVLVGIALVAVWTVVIPKEEAKLIDHFGDQYQNMIDSTGRLLPRFRL